jgi:hypothetical protein
MAELPHRAKRPTGIALRIMTALNANASSVYLHVFVPVEALIWIRSLASVLLIVAHALRHVEMKKVAGEATPSPL